MDPQSVLSLVCLMISGTQVRWSSWLIHICLAG